MIDIDIQISISERSSGWAATAIMWLVMWFVLKRSPAENQIEQQESYFKLNDDINFIHLWEYENFSSVWSQSETSMDFPMDGMLPSAGSDWNEIIFHFQGIETRNDVIFYLFGRSSWCKTRFYWRDMRRQGLRVATGRGPTLPWRLLFFLLLFPFFPFCR